MLGSTMRIKKCFQQRIEGLYEQEGSLREVKQAVSMSSKEVQITSTWIC